MMQRPSRRANEAPGPLHRGRPGVLVLAGLAAIQCLLVGGAPAVSATSLPSSVEAWIYPGGTGEPTCDSSAELSALAADPVALLKPQYMTVSGSGNVVIDTAAKLPCNGFDAANLAAVRASAHKVYVTISAGTRATKTLLANPTKRAVALASIESFVSTNGIDGVDLDFEPNIWTATMWSEYTGFVANLVRGVSPQGRGVEVDLEPFATTPWDAERYGDIASAGAHLVVMAYDNEFAAACAAITPYAWLRQVVTYAQSQVPASDLTVGLPSYGYLTTSCTKVKHVTSNVPYVTMRGEPGFPTTPASVEALRDPNSGEIRWQSGGVFYDYVDAAALNEKLQIVESLGVTDVSVWSLGGEPWFTGNPG